MINKTRKHEDIIVAGDLNARVKSMSDDDVVGRFAEEIENTNGERLIELCNQYQLQLTNTRFAHKNIHRYTWERPSMRQKSIIDYIITKQKPNVHVCDARVKRGANCGTDHHLLLAVLVYPFPTKNNTNRKQKTNEENKITSKRYKLHLLQDTSTRDLYQKRLTNTLSLNKPSENIEEEYNYIKNCIHKIAAEALGENKSRKRNKKQPPWLTDEVKALIKEKNQLYGKYLANKNDANRLTYKTKNRELRNKIKTEKNTQWEKTCNHINTYIAGAQSTEVWQTIKNLKTKNQDRALTIIDLKTWKDHYETLLSEKRDEWKEHETDILNSIQNDNSKYTIIELEELNKCLAEMKNGRAPGPGDIPAELIKYGGLVLTERLRYLMNLCLRKHKTPKEWKESIISSVFKKGDRKDPNNYRGISVTATISRLWGKIVQKRIRKEVENRIGEDQSGFIAGRSCVDNLFILQQLTEKMKSRDKEVHVTFIDLKKAYDTVPRKMLWHALKDIGTSTYLIEIIQEFYSDNIAYVKQGLLQSEPFQTTKGLRQGCSMSPILFNIYVETALKNWKRSCEGMGIPVDDSTLFTLSFADDQAIIAQDSYDMEFMMRRLYTEYEKWGLQVSLEKTEYLIINSDNKFEVLINDDTQIKQVDNFKYLGTTLDKDGIGQREIRTRIRNARKVIGALNPVWWDKSINLKNKKRIGQTMVETVLTYGCEVWAMREDDKRKLTAVEMDYLRRSARRSRLERIRNEQIRREMSAEETVIERIEKKSLKWFGHLLRMEETRWPKRIFQWTPPGKQKRGRPHRSWNEGIRRAMRERNLDEEMVHDRGEWRAGTGMQHLAV